MTFTPPGSGNPRGPYAPSRERARFGSEFVSALRRDFRQGGPAAIAKVRKYHPAAYMKICALVIPKEMKVEHSDGIKAMSDEQLDEALDALRELLAARAADAANVIEGTAEPVALPPPEATDEQNDAALDALREITRGVRRRGGENVITAEPVALPGSEAQSPEATPQPPQKHKSNRMMREADTAVGSRERKPRMRKVPSRAEWRWGCPQRVLIAPRCSSENTWA